MKVKELKQILEQVDDNDEVSIIIKPPRPTVGPVATVPVRWAHAGFDWERGRFLLYPQRDLQEIK